MSLWQFNAAVKGYVKANTSKEKGEFQSEEEKDDVWNWLLGQNEDELKTRTNKIYLWDGKNFTLDKTVTFEAK